MRIQIREQDVALTKAHRDHVERRVGLALGRFAGRISAVTVRFSMDSGDKRCEIYVALRSRKVRAAGTNADLFAAVDHATERVSSSVDRALERDVRADDSGVWLKAPTAPKIKTGAAIRVRAPGGSKK